MKDSPRVFQCKRYQQREITGRGRTRKGIAIEDKISLLVHPQNQPAAGEGMLLWKINF